MTNRVLAFAVAVTLFVVASVSANDNVRAVQTKLRDGGFYLGEIDGAYSSQLSAALTRYQIRNGLPITGQLDVDTSKALGAKPAVTTSPADSVQGSDTWRRLRTGERQTMATTNARESTEPASAPPTAAQRPVLRRTSARNGCAIMLTRLYSPDWTRTSARKRISSPIASITMTRASLVAKKSGRI